MIRYVNGDVSYDVEELPLDRWIEIQRVTGKQWHECLSQQLLGDVLVAKAVLEACAAETGSVLPALTVKSVLKLFKFSDDESVPSQFSEGIPDPKVEGSDPVTI